MALFSRSLIPSFALPFASPAADLSLPPTLPTDSLAQPEAEIPVEAVEEVEEETAQEPEAMDLDDGPAGTTTTVAFAVPKASTSRTKTIGDAFFPPRAFFPAYSPRQLTLANPGTTSHPRLSLPAAPSTRAPLAARKSLSPHQAQSHSGPGTLSALPVAREFHALKDRTASVVSSLASEKTGRTAEMRLAGEKIAGLEKALEEARMEAEGWEAECGRMKEGEGEVRRVEEVENLLVKVRGELEGEKVRKRKYKDEGARLRMELGARRLKERWELGIMDAEDRMREAAMVGLEYDLAMTRMQLGLERIHVEELEVRYRVPLPPRTVLTIVRPQESNLTRTTRLSELSASRTILLKSFNTSEATLDTLRSELTSSRKLTQESKSSVAELKNSFKALEGELEDGNTLIEELENEVESLRNELNAREKADKGEKKSEGKEVAEAKQALEKEKAKREKVETDAKELKVRSSSSFLRALTNYSHSSGHPEESPIRPSRRHQVARHRQQIRLARHQSRRTRPSFPPRRTPQIQSSQIHAHRSPPFRRRPRRSQAQEPHGGRVGPRRIDAAGRRGGKGGGPRGGRVDRGTQSCRQGAREEGARRSFARYDVRRRGTTFPVVRLLGGGFVPTGQEQESGDREACQGRCCRRGGRDAGCEA